MGTIEVNPLPAGRPTIDPLDRDERLATLHRQGDKIENHLADLEQRLTSHLDAGLERSAAPLNDMANRLQGYLGANIDAEGRNLGKITQKLYKRSNDLQGNAYQGIYTYGGRYPTDEEVLYGLQTGDYLGSVGLPSNGPKTPPIQPGSPPGLIPPLPPPGPVGAPPQQPPPILPPPVQPPPILPPPTQPPPTQPPPVAGPGPVAPPVGPPVGPVPPGGPVDPPPVLPPPGNDLGCDRTWITPHGNDWKLSNPITLNGAEAYLALPSNFSAPTPNGHGGWIIGTLWINVNGVMIDTYYVSTVPRDFVVWGDPATGEIYVGPWMPPGMCLMYETHIWDIFDDVNPPPSPDPDPNPPPPPATCLPPKVEPCPEIKGPPVKLDFEADDYCAALDDLRAQWDKVGNAPVKMIGMTMGFLADNPIGKVIAQAMTGVASPIVPEIIGRLNNYLQGVIRELTESSNCERAGLAAVSVFNGALGFLEKWTGAMPPQVMEYQRQVANGICPVTLPSGAEADEAFLADQITQAQWECWQRAHGNRLTEHQAVRDAGRQRPGPREIDLLLRRKLIDHQTFEDRMRGVGVLKKEDQQAFRDLNLQYPDRSDLIRFMVRDVFDEQIVEDSGLDIGFTDKFVGDAVDYADALGINQNHMRYAWRAHWQLPSLTMAGQMLARCRQGKVPDNAVVTEDDVLKLLKQDDWAPAWIPSMMEILKMPLTRVDTRRMYQLHNATEEELKDYYLDLRYSDKDAAKLVDFAKRTRDVAEAKSSGLPTQRTAIMEYARGEMTGNELRGILEEISLTPALANKAMQSAFTARTIYQRRQMTAAVHRSFLNGITDEGDATAKLARAQVDAGEIQELLELWREERDARGKHAPAAQLCKWRSLNLIGPTEQQDALQRLGWSYGDAARIVSQCEIELTLKQQKAAEKAQKDELRALEKAQAKAKAKAKEDGTLLPIRKRVITVKKTAGKATIEDRETIPVPALPGSPEVVAENL